MNKLAEQLSNDIAIRAAQKLAALNGGMEKSAGVLTPNEIAQIFSMGGIGGGLSGMLAGGLTGLTYNNPEDPEMADPTLMQRLGNGLTGAAVGGLVGLPIGALSGTAAGALGRFAGLV